MTDVIIASGIRVTGYSGLGHWNDPEMLGLGNGGMKAEECRTHMNLWAMVALVLIAGTKEILINRDVIAVNQHNLGKFGVRVNEPESRS